VFANMVGVSARVSEKARVRTRFASFPRRTTRLGRELGRTSLRIGWFASGLGGLGVVSPGSLPCPVGGRGFGPGHAACK
jgi:hypothetical protein